MSKQIEQIITEVQRRLDTSKKVLPELRCPENISYYKGCIEAYEWVISFLQLIPEEDKEEPVSNDLEEVFGHMADTYYNDVLLEEHQMPEAIAHQCRLSYFLGLKAGANWQEQQDEKDISDMLFVEYLRGADEGKRMMTEKACNYLKDHIDEGLVIYHNDSWQKRDELIKKFCNAMAE